MSLQVLNSTSKPDGILRVLTATTEFDGVEPTLYDIAFA